jgi:hypothetical protein
MKPVDHVNPTVPSNWVRRVEDRKRRRDPRRQPGHQNPAPADRPPPGREPDGRTRHIDDLA